METAWADRDRLRDSVLYRGRAMSVNLEYYKVFYYVAEYLNITRASEKLCLSQPTVTREIKGLEEQIGCRLFRSCLLYTSRCV